MEYLFQLNNDIDITQVGYSICKESWGIFDRTIGENELIVVYQGILYCSVEDESYVIKPGEAFIIPKNRKASQYSGDGRCRFYYAHFSGLLQPILHRDRPDILALLDADRRIDAEHSLYLPTGSDTKRSRLILCTQLACGSAMEEIKSLFAKALIERNHTNIGRLPLITAYISNILITIGRRYTNMFLKTETTSMSQKKLIQDALSYIDEHYTDSISILELSGKLGISQQYMSKMFRDELGISPVKYINRFRVRKAKQLFVNTNLNISEIAFRVGFDSPYYFNRVFKQFEGMSPTIYKLWLDAKSNEI